MKSLPALSAPVVLLVSLIAGCAVSPDRISVTRYKLVVTPDTRQDWVGNGCDAVHGEVMLTEGHLSGLIIDSWGDRYTLSGNSTEDGQLESGLAYNSRNRILLSGELIERGGDGQWQDRFGCNGRWSAIRL